MGFLEHPKFSIGGFSGKRVGYPLAVVSLALIPAHFYISCEASSAVACMGLIVFGLTGVFSLAVPRGTPQRFRPLAFASVALVGHMLCTH